MAVPTRSHDEGRIEEEQHRNDADECQPPDDDDSRAADIEVFPAEDVPDFHTLGHDQPKYKTSPFDPRLGGVEPTSRCVGDGAGRMDGVDAIDRSWRMGRVFPRAALVKAMGRDVHNPDNPHVTLSTNHGDVVVELFADRAPRTVENFLGLARHDPAANADPAPDTNTWEDPETGEVRGDSLYEGNIFHRVINGFMIQGGDPVETGRGGPGYQFEDEFHDELTHDGPGILSMANSGPDTNGSQFFITLDGTPHLDGKHAVFGQVVEGMNVVEAVGSLPTDRQDEPEEAVEIERVDVDD